jgi:hypothetical protein
MLKALSLKSAPPPPPSSRPLARETWNNKRERMPRFFLSYILGPLLPPSTSKLWRTCVCYTKRKEIKREAGEGGLFPNIKTSEKKSGPLPVLYSFFLRWARLYLLHTGRRKSKKEVWKVGLHSGPELGNGER